MTMRTIFKILLVPVWLVLSILKLAFQFAAGTAVFVLAIGGGMLLMYDLIQLIIGNSSNEFLLDICWTFAFILT